MATIRGHKARMTWSHGCHTWAKGTHDMVSGLHDMGARRLGRGGFHGILTNTPWKGGDFMESLPWLVAKA